MKRAAWHATVLAFVIALTACVFSVAAQQADQRSPLTPRSNSDQPKNIREMQKKMQIDQAKKEYKELLDRGELALKISSDLEKVFSDRKELTHYEHERLEDLEKIVKKIRSELGGGDGDDKDPDHEVDSSPSNVAEGFRALQSMTVKLVDELKRSSRFGISAVAIQSSNAVLKIVRFLRLNR